MAIAVYVASFLCGAVVSIALLRSIFLGAGPVMHSAWLVFNRELADGHALRVVGAILAALLGGALLSAVGGVLDAWWSPEHFVGLGPSAASCGCMGTLFAITTVFIALELARRIDPASFATKGEA